MTYRPIVLAHWVFKVLKCVSMASNSLVYRLIRAKLEYPLLAFELCALAQNPLILIVKKRCLAPEGSRG